MKISISELQQTFVWAYHHPKALNAKRRSKDFGLCPFVLEIGYNSGRWKKNLDESNKQTALKQGWTQTDFSKSGKFKGDHSLTIPLKNKIGQPVNWVFIPISGSAKVSFLNLRGFYPEFPKEATKSLILCSSIWDALTLHQTKLLGPEFSVLWKGPKGLSHDVKNYLMTAEKIANIVWLKESMEPRTNEFLNQNFPGRYFVSEDIQLYQNWRLKGDDVITNWLNEKEWTSHLRFKIRDEDNFDYDGAEVEWKLRGRIPLYARTLVFSCQLRSKWSQDVYRFQLDLNDDLNSFQQLFFWSEKEKISASGLIEELKEIRKHLEKFRTHKAFDSRLVNKEMSSYQVKELLASETLWGELDTLLEKSGLVGQERIRRMAFLLALSYKASTKFHCVLLTEDVYLGREFVQQLQTLFPGQDTYTIDVTTNKSFRHYKNPILEEKLILIPDYNGVTQNSSIDDFKRIQMSGHLVNEIPIKNALGFVQTIKQEVKGNGASIGAFSGKKEIFINEFKTILLHLDNSQTQLNKLVKKDALSYAGKWNVETERLARNTILRMIQELKALEVENKFVLKLAIPENVPNNRMLSIQLWSTINLVTWLHQKQRDTTSTNKLISTFEDVEIGIELFLNSVSLQLDDLETKERVFFESTKKAIIKKGEERTFSFTSKWIQDQLHISKSNANRNLKALVDKEYLTQTGSMGQGWSYKVKDWDDQILQKMKLKKNLLSQCDPNHVGSRKSSKKRLNKGVTQKSKNNVADT